MNRVSILLIGALMLHCLISPSAAMADADREVFPPLPAYVVIGEPATPDDERAIRELMRSSGRGWGRGDAAGVAAAYGDDAEWMNAFGDVRRGPEAIQAYLSDLFENEEGGLSESEQVDGRMISLRYIGNDVAVLHFVTRSSRAGALEGAEHRQVHTTSVLAKEDGHWTIVHEHISDVRPRTTIQAD